MAHSVRGTLTAWQLPGRLCEMWVDMAACGRGAAWGGLECKPARRPERNRRGEKNKTHTLKTGTRKQPRWSRAPRWPSGRSWVRAPGEGSARSPGLLPMATHQTHKGTQYMTTEVGHSRPPGARGEEGEQHLLWLRPWWNVPGAGPVTMASLETPALAEESALNESTRRGNGEIIPRELEFTAPGSFGLPAL